MGPALSALGLGMSGCMGSWETAGRTPPQATRRSLLSRPREGLEPACLEAWPPAARHREQRGGCAAKHEPSRQLQVCEQKGKERASGPTWAPAHPSGWGRAARCAGSPLHMTSGTKTGVG